jgi:heat shock protein HspQ
LEYEKETLNSEISVCAWPIYFGIHVDVTMSVSSASQADFDALSNEIMSIKANNLFIYLFFTDELTLFSWYVPNKQLHTDLGISPVREVITNISDKYKDKLTAHPNELASTLLNDEVEPHH